MDVHIYTSLLVWKESHQTMVFLVHLFMYTFFIMVNGNNIKSWSEENHCKYLGILQAKNIKHAEDKKVSSEYIRREKSINSVKEITIKEIDTWVIGAIRYTAQIVNWI